MTIRRARSLLLALASVWTSTACRGPDPASAPTAAPAGPAIAIARPAPSSAAPAPAPPPTDVRAPLGESVALPGPCVPVPQIERPIAVTWQQSSPPDTEYATERRSTVSVATRRTIDVDGDGVQDTLVPEPGPRDCPHDARHALYVMRGACGHRLGTIVGAPVLAPQRSHGGLPELTTAVEYGAQPDPRDPARLRTERRTYRFDGEGYREVARADDSVVCHHCGLLDCSARGP